MTAATPVASAARTARPRTAPAPARGRGGPGLLATLLTLAGMALLISLGVWQLERLTWKTGLVRRIEALRSAPAEPLNVVLNRVRDGGELDFVRVVTPCEGLADASVPLYGLRDAGPGWRRIAACRLPGGAFGSILVDLGFAAEPPGAAPAAEPAPGVVGATVITGVLRRPEPRPWFDRLVATPRGPQGLEGEFFQRDIPAMAQALHATRPAPVMLTLESPRAGPKLDPSPLPYDLPNRHLEYALTWFGLAAALVGVWMAMLISARRGRG